MTACFICRREGVPHLTFKTKPLCQTCAPNALAGEMMLEFSETEEEAIEAGGEVAGAFLDSIDKTDLADLSADQWTAFLQHFLGGYSAHMRGEAVKYPPF